MMLSTNCLMIVSRSTLIKKTLKGIAGMLIHSVSTVMKMKVFIIFFC